MQMTTLSQMPPQMFDVSCQLPLLVLLNSILQQRGVKSSEAGWRLSSLVHVYTEVIRSEQEAVFKLRESLRESLRDCNRDRIELANEKLALAGKLDKEKVKNDDLQDKLLIISNRSRQVVQQAENARFECEVNTRLTIFKFFKGRGCADKNSIKHTTMSVLLFQTIAPGISLPPQPVLIRWKTWLDAVNYYAKYYSKIMEVIHALDNTDSSAVAAVKSLPSEQLLEDIVFIDSNFKIVSKSITLLESSNLQLSEALNIVYKVSQTVIQNNNSQISEKVICKLRNIIAKNSAYSQLRIINDVLSGHDKTSEVGVLKSSDFLFFKYVRITLCVVEHTFSQYKNCLSDHRRKLLCSRSKCTKLFTATHIFKGDVNLAETKDNVTKLKEDLHAKEMRPEDVARAVALYNDGRSVRYIANVMNIARSTTHDAIKRYRETLEYTRRPGSGRPRATNTNEERYMVLRVLRERNLPATSVAQQFVNMHGRPISAKTVRRRLKASGLISSRPATGPRLLRMHRVERLRFANDHRDWRNGQWSCVLFIDEFRFNLCSPDGRQRVWRRRGERFSQRCISENVPYGGGGVMVWAGLCTDTRTELVFVENGRLTADRYINECLADHVVPFGQFVGDNFVLMHDNALPHIAHAVGDYLQEVEIHVLPWPTRSPDMNPTEHVWGMLGRRVKLAEANDTLGKLEQDLQAKENEVNEMAFYLQESYDHIKIVENDVAVLMQDLQTTKVKLDVSEKKVTTLIDEVNDTKTKLQESERLVTNLAQEVTDTKTRLEASEKQITSLSQEVIDTRTKLDESQREVTTLTQQVTDAKTKLDESERKVTTLTKQVTDTKVVSPDVILDPIATEKSPVRQTPHNSSSRQLNQYHQEMSHWKAEFENITTEEDFYRKVDNFSQFLANAITLLPGPKHPARKYYEARQDKRLLNNQRSYEQSSNPERATKRDREKRRSKYMYQLTQFQYFNQRRKAVHSILRQNNQRCTINVNKVHNSFSKNFSVPNNCIRPSYEHVSDTDDLTPTETFSTTITKEEIVAAANKIAVDTSPGPDHVLMRAIRNAVCYEIISLIATRMLSLCEIPPCLTKAQTILIYKGGDVTDLGNWRPITICSILRRIIERVLDKRLRKIVTFHEFQRGFTNSPGTLINTSLLNSILKEAKSRKTNTTLVFLDIRKAFDNIGHLHLRNTLSSLNVPSPLAELIAKLQEVNTTQIEVNHRKTEPIVISRGVMQGSPLSPSLCNIATDHILHELASEELAEEYGFKLVSGLPNVTVLSFADDMVIVGKDSEAAKHIAEIATRRLYEI
ncbi:hypothetical protein ANN_05356 [Periplaneta americana]|uniref:Reverse transcriptase domain-containing protein n=1 Tax=Periplaneta americana TaxID=6978 RepID=A0ABQ8TAW1_PERAM|nr:hypothetical protein ANN_05356 [Periplaneta americana]